METHAIASIQAFFDFKDAHPDQYFELIEGIVVEVPSPSSIHNFISLAIGSMFRLFSHIGFAFGDNQSFQLQADTIVVPDAAFILKTRQPKLTDQPYFALAPDIAVEVMSPSNTRRQMLHKINLYLAAGTSIVWVVYPDERMVEVYTRSDDGALIITPITEDDTLTGGSVLPDFSVPARDIFPPADLLPHRDQD